MPTLTLVCTIHGPDLASDGALPDVSCAPVHGRRTALQTWASRKPRRLRLDGQGRDVERSRLADEGAELASVRLQRLVRKGERRSRDGADGALSRRTEVRLGRESPGTRPYAGQGDGRPHAAGKLGICGVVPL